MQEFELFGAQHIVALLLVGVFSVLSFRLGKTKLANLLAKLGAVVLGGYGVWLWSLKLQNGFQAELDLPLALCDLIFIFCLLAFIRPYPLLVTLVTYWGLAGTLQALITPDVERAFPSAEFTLFFLGHSVIIFAVVFLLGWAPHEKLAGWSGIKVSFSYLLRVGWQLARFLGPSGKDRPARRRPTYPWPGARIR